MSNYNNRSHNSYNRQNGFNNRQNQFNSRQSSEGQECVYNEYSSRGHQNWRGHQNRPNNNYNWRQSAEVQEGVKKCNGPQRSRSYNNETKNKYYKPKPKLGNPLVEAVQQQTGIGKQLILVCRDGENPQNILHASASKINSTMKIDIVYGKSAVAKHYQLKIGNILISEGEFDSMAEAKKHLSDMALKELQKVCFTIIKKTDPRDLPKVDISSSASNEFVGGMSGIGAKMMAKMGWSGKGGLGSHEQGRTDIVKPHFHIDRQGFGTKNITEEVKAVLEQYSASQDINSIAFSPDFTKEERAAIHMIARKLNLRTRSYGKADERFLIVENRIRMWDLIYLLLDSNGENEQYKLVIPTNFCKL